MRSRNYDFYLRAGSLQQSASIQRRIFVLHHDDLLYETVALIISASLISARHRIARA